jgi:glycosyltransferase involved in cell wall biosynthesis
LYAADHAVFNSRLCRDGWEAHYEIPTGTSVLYNGVDPGVFCPQDVTGDPYVLFVGNDERKGLSRVLDYAPRAELPVHLVGPSEVDVPGAVARGRVDAEELPSIYSGASVTIHPTGFEPFGNVALESLACGTPVVTTERCGAAEVLDQDCAVITEDIESGVAHARHLDGADCVSTAEEYTWSQVAERTLSIVTDVLSH